MKFRKLVTLLENVNSKNVFFVEDDHARIELVRKYFQVKSPDTKLAFADNTDDALEIIKNFYSEMTFISLDYNLMGGETTEPIAWALNRLGNDGSNVFIHSNDPDGVAAIREILPKAKDMQMPQNILAIIQA